MSRRSHLIVDLRIITPLLYRHFICQVRAIPTNLVTCLPAQAVACRLAGLPTPVAKNSATDDSAAVALFEEMVKDAKFRVRVESLSGKEGVTIVQASTLDRPAVNINRRLAEAKPQRLAANSSSSSEPLEVIVTHVSSGSIFGQPRYESRPFCWLCFCTVYCLFLAAHFLFLRYDFYLCLALNI